MDSWRRAALINAYKFKEHKVVEDLNIWDRRYQQIKQLWGLNPDSKLMQYSDLVKSGDVLDFELISCCEGLKYVNEQNSPHYHGIVDFLVRIK